LARVGGEEQRQKINSKPIPRSRSRSRCNENEVLVLVSVAAERWAAQVRVRLIIPVGRKKTLAFFMVCDISYIK